MAEEIKDISLSSKKSFRIDGDNERIIRLDTSDMNVIVRLNEVYPDIVKLAKEAQDRISKVKLQEPEEEIEEIAEDTTEEAEDAVEVKKESKKSTPLQDLSEILTDIDKRMREKVDYIFASEVSDICVPNGNMFDPVGGEYRFEHLIDVLSNLYANNFKAEFHKMQERVKKHTAKYANKKRR